MDKTQRIGIFSILNLHREVHPFPNTALSFYIVKLPAKHNKTLCAKSENVNCSVESEVRRWRHRKDDLEKQLKHGR